jgi:hypothetical protein
VVLVMSAVNRVDTTALSMLEGLDQALQQAGVVLHLAEIKGPVADILQRAGLAARFAGRVHLSTQAAWQAWPAGGLSNLNNSHGMKAMDAGQHAKAGLCCGNSGADRFAGSACNQIAVACSHPR